MDGAEPDWARCSYFNHPGNVKGVAAARERARIYPQELRPEGAASWTGIPFEEWFVKRTAPLEIEGQ